MNRPYIICHMVTSIDGKVTGKFLESEAGLKVAEQYYKKHREFGSNGFICGRFTMESSFTGGWYPDLTAFARADVIDELSLVQAPVLGEKGDKPLFYDEVSGDYQLLKAEMLESAVWLRNHSNSRTTYFSSFLVENPPHI